MDLSFSFSGGGGGEGGQNPESNPPGYVLAFVPLPGSVTCVCKHTYMYVCLSWNSFEMGNSTFSQL